MTGRKTTALGAAGLLALGLAGATGGPASAAEPPRRVVVSGTVYQMDDETFGSNERCNHRMADNDVVYYDQQLLIDGNWSCGGEVNTQLVAFADLLPGGAVRFHGEVVLREGTCGCMSDPIRMRKGIDQVVTRDGNVRVGTGYMQWSGGDATEVTLQVHNRNP
ncbi:hypothetical protein ACIBF1_36940 [Spirillospora sp. NPDC050679]